jgi:hypothetical protein
MHHAAMPPPSTFLDMRTLNRTLLERQGLLRRTEDAGGGD